MKACVILAHPYQKSFNHAIFNTVCKKLEDLNIGVFAHDLYKENFNPVLTVNELGNDTSDDPLVNKYADELLQSEFLFFIHPNWWGQPPAIMKGYIDRVIRPPYSYEFPENDSGGGIAKGKLKGKYGVVFNTSNTEEERENKYFGDPLEKIWRQCIFAFCGIDKYYRKIFRIVADSNLNQRILWLGEVESIVEETILKRTVTMA